MARLVRILPLPHLWQELLQFAQRRLADLGQHAAEVRLRVDPVRLGRCNQAPQHRVVLPEGIVAGEQPVLPPDGRPLQGPLGGVVVDVQEPRLAVAAQGIPLIQRVPDGPGHRAARQHQLLLLVQPRLDLRQNGYGLLLAQLTAPIPTGDLSKGNLTYAKASFPKLVTREPAMPHLSVYADGQMYQTEEVASIDGIIAREFKDDLPLVITRTIISAVFKAAATEAARRALSDKGSDSVASFLVLAGGIAWQEITSRADTRQWTTLPKDFQIARIPMPADRTVTLQTPGGPTPVVLEPGNVKFVYVKAISATAPVLVWQGKLQ